jgi:putative spermidine/putrescine transport system permease protein
MTRALTAGVALRAFVVLVVVWLMAPGLIMIPLSFAAERSFVFPPDSWSLRWFDNLFSSPEWRSALLSSFRIATEVVLLSTAVGTACALGLDRGRMVGAAALRALILSPMIVPLVITGIGIYAVFLPWRLVGTEIGFVLGHTVIVLPFVVVAVTTSLAGFDRRLEDAAATLGAGQITTFFKVTFPIIRPGIVAGAVFAFILSFDDLAIALFLSSPDLRTIPVTMYASLDNIDPTMAASATLLLLVTTTVMLLGVMSSRSLRVEAVANDEPEGPPVVASSRAPER